MEHITELQKVLSKHLGWHGARLKFLAMFIIAIMKVKTVNMSEISIALNPKTKQKSNYRRLQRFFSGFEIDYEVIAKVIISLIPRAEEGYILSMDRTNWRFGKKSINLLVLAVVHEGVAFPVYWSFLDKKGNSNTQERIELMSKFIATFGRESIACLTADREFVGQAWFKYLRKAKVIFRIRIKENFYIGVKNSNLQGRVIFSHLAIDETLILANKRFVCGHRLYVIGLRLKNEYLILVTNFNPLTALDDYAKRWQIETLFAILKSRGFRFEETHLTDGQRINKLLALLSLASLWAFKLGQWRNQIEPLRIKKHGRLVKSLFRHGLDFLRAILFDIHLKLDDFLFSLTFLSCT